MSERDYLTQQIVSLEAQRQQFRDQALQCDGGLRLCRHRLAILDREEAARTTTATLEAEQAEQAAEYARRLAEDSDPAE